VSDKVIRQGQTKTQVQDHLCLHDPRVASRNRYRWPKSLST